MILVQENKSIFSQWLQAAREDGGTALIYKEIGWTSFDVVAKLRNTLRIKKVGHCGTLDPLASGLLILCFGKHTKTISSYQDLGKEYIAEVALGGTTATDDAEAEVENITSIEHIKREDINNSVAKFIGEIEQIPPAFSAKKVDGKRLYQLARKNIDIQIRPSIVNVYSNEIIDYSDGIIKLKIHCSKGTYIRSIARDIGAELKVGGYLKSLERTAIGNYRAVNALKINEIIDAMNLLNGVEDANIQKF